MSFLRKFRNFFVFTILCISSILLIANPSDQLKEESNKVFMTISQPFIAIGDWVVGFVGNTFKGITDYGNLQSKYNEKIKEFNQSTADENRRLKSKIIELERQLAIIEGLNSDESIAPFVGEDLDYEGAMWAKVILKSPSKNFESYYIDKGSNHKLLKGMPVIAFQDDNQGLVGFISAVSGNVSQFIPITDTQSQIAAKLLVSNGAYDGVLVGGGEDHSLTMLFVNVEAKVQKGDLVVTQGKSKNFNNLCPSGLNLGRVESFRNETQTSLKVEVKPMINIQNLDHVLILRLSSVKLLKELQELAHES